MQKTTEEQRQVADEYDYDPGHGVRIPCILDAFAFISLDAKKKVQLLYKSHQLRFSSLWQAHRY